MRVTLIALAALATVAAVAGIAAAQESATPARSAVAELRLDPSVPNGPRGVGLFRQTGARLRGWVAVWGLAPGSKHAVHFHGPKSACGKKADPAAVHQDLAADSRGVAYARVDVTSRVQVLRSGFYYNVHVGPSTESQNPEIACANVVPIR
jgi:hypothetical protein